MEKSKLQHDIHAEIAKIKTSLSLMQSSSVEEIRGELVPMILRALQKLESLVKD